MHPATKTSIPSNCAYFKPKLITGYDGREMLCYFYEDRGECPNKDWRGRHVVHFYYRDNFAIFKFFEDAKEKESFLSELEKGGAQ